MFYIFRHPEWFKWGDWLLAALAGAIATILLQAVYDSIKERREIRTMRDAIYASLAEIFVASLHTATQAKDLYDRESHHDAESVVQEYRNEIGLSRYDEQLRKAQEKRSKLAPEVDVFATTVNLLSVASTAQGDFPIKLEAVTNVLKKLMYEVRMEHLDEKTFERFRHQAVLENARRAAKVSIISVEDFQAANAKLLQSTSAFLKSLEKSEKEKTKQ